MPFNEQEIKALVDLAFIVRRDYKMVFGTPVFQQVLDFQQNIAQSKFVDLSQTAAKSTIISQMGATRDGQYAPNHDLIDRLRIEIGAQWVSVTPPNYTTTVPTSPPPVEQPPTNTSDEVVLLKKRISDLEALVAAGGGAGKPLVIEGDVIFKGRVGLGGLIDDSRSPLQLVGETSIMFANNFNKDNPDASDVNYGVVGMSGDGGVRTLQNGYFSRREIDAYDPDGRRWFKSTQVWPNPTRAQVNVGPDSRGDWSLSKKMPKGQPGDDHEYTQDVVFRIDEANKRAGFRLYRPGFKWEFGIDSKYGPETFWTPELYVSRG
jgi:hypothetical protein